MAKSASSQDHKKKLLTSTAAPPSTAQVNDDKPDDQTSTPPRARARPLVHRVASSIPLPTIHRRQGDRGSGDDAAAPSRWTRNSATARYLGVSNMCLWRWKRDARLAFPDPAVINGIEYNNLNLVDQWIKARVVSRVAREAARCE